jgi:hypothetical protein
MPVNDIPTACKAWRGHNISVHGNYVCVPTEADSCRIQAQGVVPRVAQYKIQALIAQRMLATLRYIANAIFITPIQY